ncbi:MAG: hypothetical protein GXY91_04575 [Clostridia bacterium]|nr:hypothetical protein [Clostridia bacterium]
MAENIMLAVYSNGIGSCLIGFTKAILNTREFKEFINQSCMESTIKCFSRRKNNLRFFLQPIK